MRSKSLGIAWLLRRAIFEMGWLWQGMAVFDIAILDINIGGYSISPVAEILADRGLPFFFVSGYGAAGRPEAYSDRPVLQKPLLMAKLGEAINSILSTGNVSARGA
jgi:hypothetical protein